MKLCQPSVHTHREEQEWNTRILASSVYAAEVKLWKYSAPAVVVGCSQRRTVNAYDCMQRAGIEAIGRRAGGGAVLVGPWMSSISVALPNSHPLVANGPTSSYQWIGEVYLSVLNELGVNAQIVKPDSVKQLMAKNEHKGLDWACFGTLSPWEVTAGGKKIVGLAQVRRRTGVLLVAGLLVSNPDWSLLCRALDKPSEDANKLINVTTSCEEQLKKTIALNDICSHLLRGISSRVGYGALALVKEGLYGAV